MNPLPALWIRNACTGDIPLISSITRDAFRDYAKHVGDSIPLSALQETHEDIARALLEKHVLVAEMDGQIVGSVRYENLGGGVGYLSRFGVSPALQQGGVGSALIDAVSEGCRALGLQAVALHTGARISHLVQFYYRSGYFIYSTTQSRGYTRALLIRELESDAVYDLSAAQQK